MRDLDVCRCGHTWMWHDDGEEVIEPGRPPSTFCWADKCKCTDFAHAFEAQGIEDWGKRSMGAANPEKRDEVRQQGCICGHVRFMHKETDWSCMHSTCKCEFFRTTSTAGEGLCKTKHCVKPVHGTDVMHKDSSGAYWSHETQTTLADIRVADGVNTCVCGHIEQDHSEYEICLNEDCNCSYYKFGGSKPIAKTEFEEANAAALNQIEKGDTKVGKSHNYGHYSSNYTYEPETCTVEGCGHPRTRHGLNKGKDAECLDKKGCKCTEYFGKNKDKNVSEGASVGGYYGTTVYASCGHKPQMIIDGENWSVWAGTKYNCTDQCGEFDVLLNCSNSGSMTYKHKINIPGFEKYEHGGVREIELDWPDQGVPGLPAQFWWDMKEYLRDSSFKLLAFCIGGHGRTGTAIAALMLASGYSLKDAVNFIHKNYCKKAIESKVQEKYLVQIAKDMLPIIKAAEAKEEAVNDAKSKGNAPNASKK